MFPESVWLSTLTKETSFTANGHHHKNTTTGQGSTDHGDPKPKGCVYVIPQGMS